MKINRKMTSTILIMLIFSSSIFAGCSNQSAHDASDSISILFVGNSHVRTGNVPGQLQAIASLHGIELTYVDVSRNGANLDGAMRDNAIRRCKASILIMLLCKREAGAYGQRMI
ncbi:MAG: hypothetical protein FWD03_07905 [Defluviitaleaceae bacterium]|nr:hypothetical protein [Defluviitaleaceae bacterium]